MNFFAINSNSFNGGVAGLVLATAAITGSAAVSATGHHQYDALAPATSAAYVLAEPTVTRHVLADLIGSVQVQGVPTHIQASSAELGGSADIVAAVLRIIECSAVVQGEATIQAIVASALGSADADGQSSIVADATLVQAGYGYPSASAVVTLTAEPVVTRYVEANLVLGTAQVRGEYAVNGVLFSYADLVGTAQVTPADLGIVFRMATGNATCTTQSQATATQILPGFADLVVSGEIDSINAYSFNSAIGILSVEASITAAPEIYKQPSALVQASAILQVTAAQLHSSAAVIAHNITIVAAATVTQNLSASLQVSCQIVAQTTRTVLSDIAFGGLAQVTDLAVRTTYPSCDVSATSSITALATCVRTGACDIESLGDLLINATRTSYADSVLTGSVQLEAAAERNLLPTADVSANASLLAQPEVLIPAFSNLVGNVIIVADTIANPASIDPDYRVFLRPYQVVDFVRPTTDVIFERSL